MQWKYCIVHLCDRHYYYIVHCTRLYINEQYERSRENAVHSIRHCKYICMSCHWFRIEADQSTRLIKPNWFSGSLNSPFSLIEIQSIIDGWFSKARDDRLKKKHYAMSTSFQIRWPQFVTDYFHDDFFPSLKQTP